MAKPAPVRRNAIFDECFNRKCFRASRATTSGLPLYRVEDLGKILFFSSPANVKTGERNTGSFLNLQTRMPNIIL